MLAAWLKGRHSLPTWVTLSTAIIIPASRASSPLLGERGQERLFHRSCYRPESLMLLRGVRNYQQVLSDHRTEDSSIHSDYSLIQILYNIFVLCLQTLS